MQLGLGYALIDNTTIYGASNAYQTFPPRATDWLETSNAVNLRSLMDLLEAIVLNCRLVVDASSAYGITVRAYENTVGWRELFELGDDGGRIVQAVPFAMERDESLASAVLATALQKLRVYLGNGTFRDGIARFRQDKLSFVVPDFYRTPFEFRAKLDLSFHDRIPRDVDELVDLAADELQSAPAEESNYAMFAFRGFYYQELAHALSLSYIPHTWRTDIVSADLERPAVDFAAFALQQSGVIRQELAAKLNAEFRTPAFTSEFPVLASYIAGSCSHRSQLLPTALQIRRSSSAKAFRKWVSDIQTSIVDQGNVAGIARAKAELDQLVMDLRREFGLVSDGKWEQVKIKVGIPEVSAEVPVSVKFGVPAWLYRVLRRRTHLVFLRMIASKSVSLSPFALRFQQLLT